MFKRSRLSLLCILICCCLLVSAVPVQSSPQQQPSPRSYAVMPTTLSGGGYRLVEAAWRVNGATMAGKYRLESITAPTLTGNGCCCIYLPCVMWQ